MSDTETPDAPSSAVVVPQPARHRYRLEVDGRAVGFTGYADVGRQRVFLHTEIDPAEGGKGYASTLIAGALDDVRASGMRAVAICPFVDAYVKKHHDYDDLVDPVSIELRAALRG
ncbi:N-acetyltransferase [Herbiconiux moechotypicola]|uniref:N-acetyltransferase n=1 Tax=Herbiconiux moechotypicola TaxID=637393 RepID=A0ABN3D8C5_9MICO|nr:GNAT family N-acetyltransferase [Herbiconiux moechotypicola]MCS5728285.1 N-acetyltransferase [Herbiconiux moechotypicola]